jgi:hypothetical protein
MTTRRKFLSSLIAAVALAPVVARLTPPRIEEESESMKSFRRWIKDFMGCDDQDKLVTIGPNAYKVLTAFGEVNLIRHPWFKQTT